MAFQNHGNFFQRRISGTFANTIDSYFYLTSTVLNTGNGVGSGHTQVIVTVCGKYSIVYALHIIHHEFNFLSVLPRQTVTSCVRYIYNGSACFNNRFDHTCQIYIVGTTSIFAIELHIFHILFGMFYSSNCTFQNFVLCRVKFVFDVEFRSSNSGMNAFVFGIF